jgi:hypothetical protein
MSSTVLAPDQAQVPKETSVEISVKGEWIKVPALQIAGAAIIVRGKWLRIATVLDEEWSETDLENPELCVQTLKKHRSRALRADLFTFSQKLPVTAPKYSYSMELDSVAAIGLKSFKDWWDKLPQVTRKNVRRSEKRGVEVKVREFDDDLVRDIVELTKDSPVRQGKRFVHFGKTFEQVKKDQSTFLGRCAFICAYSEKELIGMAKIIYSGTTAAILQFLPKVGQEDKRPANALIAKMVEICEAKGISHIIYGLYNYGNKRNSSLLEFKLRNGFEEFLVPRYYVPLNSKGSLSFKLNLHRGIVGVLPNGLMTTALNLREKWYTLRGFLSRRSSMLERPNRIRQMERSIPPAGSNHDGKE